MKLNNRKLGDGIHIKHGFAFLGKYFSDQGKYILLTPGNFYEEGGFKLRPEKDRYYLGVFPNDYLLKKDDLIIAMTEQGPGLIGSAAVIPEDNIYLHNQRLGLIDEIDKNIFDKKYLYHLFNSRGVRSQIYGSVSGTKVRHTSPGRIYKVKVLVPDVVKQKEISLIIEKYNQLIDTNRRRIKLLEESAQLLFREWFVYFRFPGHEKMKIVDGVPEGWEKGKVKDLGKIVTGKTPSKKDSRNFNGTVPFIKTPDMHQSTIILKTEDFLSEIGASSQNNKYLPPWSILISCIGTVGIVAMNLFKSQTNQQINAVIPKKIIYRYYSFFCLSRLKPLLEAIGGGSTMANINKNKFENIKIIIPSENVLAEFQKEIDPVFNQIALLSDQNQKLAQARDLLLPRLMSGAIEV